VILSNDFAYHKFSDFSFLSLRYDDDDEDDDDENDYDDDDDDDDDR